jgi:hypothetical protein
MVLAVLVGWFGYGVWSLREVWRDIYVLHDRHRSEVERVQAAFALSRNPRVTERQLWDIGLRKDLPPLARYVVAEALTAEAVAGDPRGYAVAVARSEGWPGWLRLLLSRPLAYAAARGDALPREPLQELSRNPDPTLVLWSEFALAAGSGGDPAAAASIEEAASGGGPDREPAVLLRDALRAPPDLRTELLDRATLWLRTHHSEAARLWAGWEVHGDQLVTRPAPELH